jgi:hypothetical protein
MYPFGVGRAGGLGRGASAVRAGRGRAAVTGGAGRPARLDVSASEGVLIGDHGVQVNVVMESAGARCRLPRRWLPGRGS